MGNQKNSGASVLGGFSHGGMVVVEEQEASHTHA